MSVSMTALASHLSLLSLPIHLPLGFEGEIRYCPSPVLTAAPKLSLLCYKTLLSRAWKHYFLRKNIYKKKKHTHKKSAKNQN